MYLLLVRDADRQRALNQINQMLDAQMQDGYFPYVLKLFLIHAVVTAGFGQQEHHRISIDLFNSIMRDSFYATMLKQYELIFSLIRAYYS